MKTVYLVRNAEAVANVKRQFTNSSQLTANGRKQASELATFLQQFRIARLVSSPSRHAAETAQILSERLQIDSEIVEGLQNFHTGAWEGLNVDQISIEYPREWKTFKTGSLTPETPIVPEGETARAFLDRVVSTFQQVVASIVNDTSACIVSHNLSTAVILAHVAEASERGMFRFEQYNCALNQVEFTDQSSKIVFCNFIGHLSGEIRPSAVSGSPNSSGEREPHGRGGPVLSDEEEAVGLQESTGSYTSFLTHASTDRLIKVLARYDLFKMVLTRPGDIVECGVFKGAGLCLWARLTEVFCACAERKVIGFDLFGQEPEEMKCKTDVEVVSNFSDRASSLEEINEILFAQGLDHRVELVPGDVRVSIPDYVARNPGFRVALLNLDLVTYEGTVAALEHLFPLVVPGGVVVFDEYGERGFGESDAVDEYVAGRGIELRSLPWAMRPSAYVVKSV